MITLYTESVPILAVMLASVLTIVGIFVLKVHLRMDSLTNARASKKPRTARKSA